MKRLPLVLLFAAAGNSLSADPPSGGSASFQTLGGRLLLAEARWSSGDDLEARSWWREGGGSGWLRWGGLQTGPLAARTAPGGEWSWGPGTSLSEGSWGACADLGPAAAWLVETPGRLAAGGQLRAVGGGWRAAGGFCRTWNTQEPASADEYRAGMGWSGGRWPGGWDLRWRPGDPDEGRLRFRQAWDGEGAGLSAEGEVARKPDRWAAEGAAEFRAGWLRVKAGVSEEGLPDRFEAEAEWGPVAGGPLWTTSGGWGGRFGAVLEAGGWRTKASARADGREASFTAGVSGEGPAGRASAEVSAEARWTGGGKASAEARLETGNLAVGVRCTRTDAVLGWLGPGNEVAVSAEWTF